MRSNLFEIKYFETYYFANIISNILREPFAYFRSLDEFFGENNYRNFFKPFPKISRLHHFIMFIIESINFEEINSEQIKAIASHKTKLWIEMAFEHYEFKFESFDNWIVSQEKSRMDINEDDIIEYLNEIQLSGPYELLLERMANEIFFILFLNRQVLQWFNNLVANQIQHCYLEEIDIEDLVFFRRDGILKRVNIPNWVRKAVFHRDRGLCVNCNKDLSGLLSIGSTENFDHMVPLAIGGINDVTNIQLLCEACNKSKHAKQIQTSSKYEKWY